MKIKQNKLPRVTLGFSVYDVVYGVAYTHAYYYKMIIQ